jgi:hypothetical protein
MRVPMGMGESTKLLKWFQVLPHFHNFPFLDSRVSNYPTTLHLQIENPRSAHGSPQKKTQSALSHVHATVIAGCLLKTCSTVRFSWTKFCPFPSATSACRDIALVSHGVQEALPQSTPSHTSHVNVKHTDQKDRIKSEKLC